MWLRSIQLRIDKWRCRHAVCVALFGQGPLLQEWEALAGSSYSELKPRVVLVDCVGDADVLVFHGPLTKLNHQAFKHWSNQRSTGEIPLVVVGSEGQISAEGFLLGPDGKPTGDKVSYSMSADQVTPHELWQMLNCLRGRKNV